MQTRESSSRLTWRWLAVASVASLMLAGCGGGGDDEGGDDTTGLVPTAPTLGATLYNDATVLRPLVDGASWSYAGVNADGVAYTNVVTHEGVSSGVEETASDTFDAGEGSVHVIASNGSIIQPDPIDVNEDGIPDIASAVELRSPVRVNDQFVALDKRLSNMVPDIDGDGRGEALDLATYARVIGNEDVVLSGLPTMTAVRIDRITAARVVLSKDGSKLPTVTSTISTWYAPSIGIIRRRLDAPAESGVGRDVTDERITGWSGLP
ncbi:hypothetical protein AACH06_16425 [Ideonella sp. DXS29W]|uniref:Lipoprotein n=1 Tax=Ideonella lacteola TaxID=2984193 RepID=A0ABU9BVC7_9BURK